MQVHSATGWLVSNTGSQDKWQSARSQRLFGRDDGKGGATGREQFEIEITSLPQTPNNWQTIVGVVPAGFVCSGSKQWVGANKSWGYIGGGKIASAAVGLLTGGVSLATLSRHGRRVFGRSDQRGVRCQVRPRGCHWRHHGL